MTTICLWRKVHDDFRGQLSLISTYDKDRRPVALDMLRATCSNKSKLLSFLEILTSVHLARNVDRRISTIAPEAIDTLFENRRLQEPTKDDIARFRSTLGEMGHVLSLCKVGRAFQAHILGLAEFPQRQFKELPYRTLSALSLESLVEVLE